MTYLYLLLQLFYTFFIIGAFTFGGGYAMLSIIQGEVVFKHHWLTESMFTDIIAISQTTPGPIGINSATYVGYSVMHQAGANHFFAILGSFIATLAIVLPSFLLVLFIAKIYKKLVASNVFEDLMKAIRPTVVGLISAAACLMILRIKWLGTPLLSDISIKIVSENFPDIKSVFLFISAFFLAYKTKISPILLIIIAGVMGCFLY